MALIETAAATLPQRANGVTGMSAREIVRRIGARDLSSTAVVEHFIARLKAVDAKLNAVTADLFDSARQTAASVDQALARGQKLGPLAGLPVTIKECFDLAGTASTFGLLSTVFYRKYGRCSGTTGCRCDPNCQDQRTAAYDLYGN
jgi:Asp-tRNA(Asn)/Glu-tRNA(Gln) amidotransferase A subunit family amidase